MLRKLLAILLLVLMLGAVCNSKPVIPATSPLSPMTSLSATPASLPTSTPLPTATSTPAGIAPPSGLIYKMPDGLWRVEAGAQPAHLLSLNAAYRSFVLSPEGDHVLYWNWNEGDIWLGDLTTGKIRNLTNTTTRFECCPLWWPEHAGRVLFASQGSSDWPWGPTLLVAKKLSNGELHIIDRSGSFIGPAASSPDGHSIAYSRGGRPVLYHPDGEIEPFDLADFEVSITATHVVLGGPAWSPDGRHVAWTISGFYSNTQQFGTGVFDLSEHSWRLFHPYEPIGRDSFGFSSPLWSPDGKWLVMQVDTRNPVSGREEVSQQVIHVDGEDGEEHTVDPGPLIWSPDSKYLISNRMLFEVGTWRAQPLALPQDAQVITWINPTPR